MTTLTNGFKAVTIRSNSEGFRATALVNYKGAVESATVVMSKSFASEANAKRWASKHLND